MGDCVANLNGTEFGPDSSSTLATRIIAFYQSVGGVAHCEFGDVLLDAASVRSDLGHKNYLNKTHSFAAVKEVIEKGTVTTTWGYYGVHDKVQPTGVISANITIGGNPFRMDVVIIGNREGVLHVRCHDVYQLPLKENRQRESLISKRVHKVLLENSSRNPFDDGAKLCQNADKCKNLIRLNESELRSIVKECVVRILSEERKHEDHTYHPIGSHKFWSNNGRTEWKSIVTLHSPSSKQCCHIAEDDHCYVLFNGSGLEDENCKMINYIFPEAFKALKALPLL